MEKPMPLFRGAFFAVGSKEVGSGESGCNIDTTDKKKMLIHIEQNEFNFAEPKILKPRFHVNIKHFGYRKIR